MSLAQDWRGSGRACCGWSVDGPWIDAQGHIHEAERLSGLTFHGFVDVLDERGGRLFRQAFRFGRRGIGFLRGVLGPEERGQLAFLYAAHEQIRLFVAFKHPGDDRAGDLAGELGAQGPVALRTAHGIPPEKLAEEVAGIGKARGLTRCRAGRAVRRSRGSRRRPAMLKPSRNAMCGLMRAAVASSR